MNSFNNYEDKGKLLLEYQGWALHEKAYKGYNNLSWYCLGCGKRARITYSSNRKSLFYMKCWKRDECPDGKDKVVCFNMSIWMFGQTNSARLVDKIADNFKDKTSSNNSKDQDKNQGIYWDDK